jgi:Protein of unknown function (DUF3995)
MNHKVIENSIVCRTKRQNWRYRRRIFEKEKITRNILGILLVAIFTALGLLHVYRAVAGNAATSVGVPSVDGKPLFSPSTFATLMVAAALFTAALVISGVCGWLGSLVPPNIFRVMTLGISIVFLIRAVGDFRYVGFFKSVTNSGFAYWDTWLYSPLCVFIAAAASFVWYTEPK